MTRRQLRWGVLLLGLASQGHRPSDEAAVVISLPQQQWQQIAPRVHAEVDLLGVDRSGGTAQLRLPLSTLNALQSFGLGYQTLDDGRFIADVESQALEAYRDPNEVVALLRGYANDYPDLATLIEVGTTGEGRPILGLELSRKDGEANKPSILFNGMHHAREVMSAEVILDLTAQLLQGYGNDPEATQWLDRYRVVVVPQVNPDGNALVHGGQRWWRKNAYKQSGYTLGVDLNRNYPELWDGCNGSSGDAFNQTYRGPSAGSEPETKAMMALVARYRPVFNISYHSYSELIIYPFGCRSRENRAAKLFRQVAQDMATHIMDDAGRKGTYAVGTAPELLYEADGSDLDFQWAQYGVMGYTIEVNAQGQGFQPDYERWRDKTVERQRGGWKTLLRRMEGGGVEAHVNLAALTRGGQTPESELSYELSAVTGGQAADLGLKARKPLYEAWDNGPRAQRPLLRPGGMIYQPLQAGAYRLQMYRGKQRLASVAFEVGQELVQLGELSLNASSRGR